MLFWLREAAGWLIVIIAFGVLWLGITYVTDTQVVQAGVLMFVSMSLMRLGILLVRMSTAARICMRETKGK